MYLLEGNMGAGKSTFLSLIEQNLPELKVVFEPVSAWSEEGTGKPLLSSFFQDQKRWAYTLEKFTLFKRIQEHIKEQADNNNYKIMERSVYSGYYCFAKNGYLQGNLTPEEWNAYNTWFNFLVTKSCQNPSGFIYLYTTPEVCFERMHKRKREGEEIVPLDYLQQLHESHEAFLTQKKGLLPALKTVPVLTLNVCAEFANNPTVLKKHFEKIMTFIAQTQHPILSSPASCISKPL